MSNLYTNTICESGDGDIPGWLFCAICALTYVFILIDCLR